MKSTFKNKLLLGAAVTALSFGVAGAGDALANAETLTGNATWAVDADQNGAPADGTGAAANDAVDISTHTLTVLNTTSNDGSGVGTYNLGAVTGTTGTLLITSDAANVDLTANIASVTLSGAGDFTVRTLDADNSTVAATVAGATSIGGNLSVTSTEADNADTVTLTLTGNATVTGTTTLTAGGAQAGANATLNVDGASNTFTGAVTVTGGGDADADAFLVVSGAATTFTGGLALTDATGQAILNVDGGTTAQTITGNITGDGDINVANSAGATFNGTVAAGTITIENGGAALNSTATFTSTVNTGAGAITLGGAGTGTNTLNLNSAGGDFTVTGALTGAIAGETNVVNVTGGNTVTLATATAANTNIDTVAVSGNSTLTTGQNFQAGAVTVASGSTFATTGNTVTAPVANSGTLQLAGGNIVGAITGTGLLDVNNGATFNGAVTQGTADIAAVTLTQDTTAGGWNVGTTTFSGAGTLALLNGNQTIAGNFTNTTDGQGTITIANGAGTTAFTGNLGASTDNSLLALTVLGDAANLVTTTGNLFVDTITLDSTTSRLSLIGTGTQTVSGNIVGTADADGNITIGNGTNSTNAIFNGEIGDHSGGGAARNNIAGIIVDGLATATFNGGVETSGALVVGDAAAAATATFNAGLTIAGTSSLDGTVLLGDHNATTANTLTGLVTAGANQATTVTLASHTDVDGGLTLGDGAGDSLTFLIKKTATFDPTDADGNGTANEATDMILDATGQAFTRTAGTTLTIGIDPTTDPIDSGSQIQVAVDNNTGAFATGLGDGSIVLQDTAFLSLVNNTSTAGALNVRVVNKSAADVIGSDSQGVNAANTLLGISNANATAELGTIKGNIQGATTTDAATDLAESIAPTVDAGAVVGATTVVNSVSGITNTQLAALRDGTETGMVAGNISQGLRAWGQVFGQTGDQDRRDGVAGYEVDTYGVAVGLDTETLADNWIWGLGFAYADTEVDSKNVNNTETEIDSYQVTLYANYDVDDRTYITGQLGYVWGDNDQVRSNIGGAGLVARGDYDSDTIIARLEAGRHYAAGHSTTLTPKVMVNYQHYDADGYTETGTVGNAGLVVSSESLNLFEIGVGLDASWDYQNADGSFWQPKIGVGVRHDLVGDEYETTSRFIGAGGNFETKGFDPAQTTFNIGADMTYFSNSNWELSAGYDFEVKSDYDAHAGTLRAAYKF